MYVHAPTDSRYDENISIVLTTLTIKKTHWLKRSKFFVLENLLIAFFRDFFAENHQ